MIIQSQGIIPVFDDELSSDVIEQNASNRFDGEKAFGSTSDTISVTVDVTGGKRILVVATSGDDDPTGITYNGVSLTKQGGAGGGGGGFPEATLWYLVNPATGTNDLVVTGASGPDITYSGTTFLNVDQATPWSGNSTGSGGPTTSHSLGRVTLSTDLLIASSSCGADQTGGGGAQIEFGDTGPLFSLYGAGAYQPGDGGTVTNSYTHASANYAMIVSELLNDPA